MQISTMHVRASSHNFSTETSKVGGTAVGNELELKTHRAYSLRLQRVILHNRLIKETRYKRQLHLPLHPHTYINYTPSKAAPLALTSSLDGGPSFSTVYLTLTRKPNVQPVPRFVLAPSAAAMPERGSRDVTHDVAVPAAPSSRGTRPTRAIVRKYTLQEICQLPLSLKRCSTPAAGNRAVSRFACRLTFLSTARNCSVREWPFFDGSEDSVILHSAAFVRCRPISC